MTIENPQNTVLGTLEGRQFVMEILFDILREDVVFGPSDSCTVTASRLERAQVAREIRGLCELTNEGLELMLQAEQERRRHLEEQMEADDDEGDDE